MARTPLLTQFQRLFQDFSEAEATGRTVADIQQERPHRAPTRREILKASGAALATAAVLGQRGSSAHPRPELQLSVAE